METYLKTISKSIKHWYLLAISGVIFIGIGILVFTTPEESYAALSVVFSLSFLMSGIMESAFAISNRKIIEGWGWNLANSILSMIMGIFLLANPAVSSAILPYVVAFILMFRSIFAIGLSFDLKNYGIMDWGNILAIAILGLIVSFILLVNPLIAGISLVAITGTLFVITGIYSIFYAFKLKKVNKIVKKIPESIITEIKRVKEELKNIISEEAQAASAQ